MATYRVVEYVTRSLVVEADNMDDAQQQFIDAHDDQIKVKHGDIYVEEIE